MFHSSCSFSIQLPSVIFLHVKNLVRFYANILIPSSFRDEMICMERVGLLAVHMSNSLERDWSSSERGVEGEEKYHWQLDDAGARVLHQWVKSADMQQRYPCTWANGAGDNVGKGDLFGKMGGQQMKIDHVTEGSEAVGGEPAAVLFTFSIVT